MLMYVCIYIYIYIHISATVLARMACQGCVFLVGCLFIVGMFTVGMFIVSIFTVGLVLFVLKAPHPLLPRSNDVCQLFGVIF